MGREHRWWDAIKPVADVVALEPEIQVALRDDDAPAILLWVEGHLHDAENELLAHRNKDLRISKIADQLEQAEELGMLLGRLLDRFDAWKDAERQAGHDEDAQWRLERMRDDLENELVGLRGRGIPVTIDDLGTLARYSPRMWTLRKEVHRWQGVRVEVRNVAGVESKPRRR